MKNSENIELIMLVGLPGSGKSTVAEQYAQRGYHVHSSDAIRKEIYGSEEIQDNPAKVFEILLRRVRADLKQGISSVVDATNMSRKRRINFLKNFDGIDCTKRCVLLIVPVEECKRRDAMRQRSVGDAVFSEMLRGFECPYFYEGWDEIETVCAGSAYSFPFDEAAELPQDNPFHTLTLGQHMAKAEAWCREHGYSEEVCEAAHYHDCGKLYTKSFFNRKGEPTETAHYYGHENYSAYLYLCEMAGKDLCQGDAWQRTLYIANLINWHMAPLNRWKNSPETEQKYRTLVGDKMFTELMQFHEADTAAH